LRGGRGVAWRGAGWRWRNRWGCWSGGRERGGGGCCGLHPQRSGGRSRRAGRSRGGRRSDLGGGRNGGGRSGGCSWRSGGHRAGCWCSLCYRQRSQGAWHGYQTAATASQCASRRQQHHQQPHSPYYRIACLSCMSHNSFRLSLGVIRYPFVSHRSYYRIASMCAENREMEWAFPHMGRDFRKTSYQWEQVARRGLPPANPYSVPPAKKVYPCEVGIPPHLHLLPKPLPGAGEPPALPGVSPLFERYCT
jgi:hypothetical protein